MRTNMRMRLYIVMAFSATGCGGARIDPPAEVARSALVASLSAWREGKTPADVASGTPPVQVVDHDWTLGRKLSGFEVLRAEPSTADKRFAAKLSLEGPKAEAEVVYVVVGTGPVAVYRLEDYQRALNMDDGPAAAKPKRRR